METLWKPKYLARPNAMVNGCWVPVPETIPPPALTDLIRLAYPLVFDPPNSNSTEGVIRG